MNATASAATESECSVAVPDAGEQTDRNPTVPDAPAPPADADTALAPRHALPPHPLMHRPLLVVDLDETLIHSTFRRPATESADTLSFMVTVSSDMAPCPVWVAVRPFAREFLADVSAHFEVAVFSQALREYADKVCEALDPQGRLIHHRLYREHCSNVDGVFVKDLSLLGRPLHRIAIVDNSPHAYLFHPENSVPVLSWFDDPHDRELKKMTPMLVHALAQSERVYDVLRDYRQSLEKP